jgi:hypothetical protein
MPSARLMLRRILLTGLFTIVFGLIPYLVAGSIMGLAWYVLGGWSGRIDDQYDRFIEATVAGHYFGSVSALASAATVVLHRTRPETRSRRLTPAPGRLIRLCRPPDQHPPPGSRRTS